ncbi:MAG: metalloregulator ArsR/SmtB family transcription factor [Verrucomicrobiota bacterium]
MDLLKVYESFSDGTRLRILHLLTHRKSLCVCHIQSVLEEPQVKISRHLAYLRRRELVEVTQEGNWRYYSLPKPCTKEFKLNLKCLRTLAAEHATFQRDLTRLDSHAPAVETCGSC